MNQRERCFWLIVAPILFILIICFVPAHYEYCKIDPETHQKDCATYQVAAFLAIHVGEALNYWGAAVTALATVLIAGFTYTLWRTTDQQAKLTRESINLARSEFTATHRPKLILRQAFSLITDPEEHTIVVRYVLTNIGDTRCWMTHCHLGIELVSNPEYPYFFMTPDMQFPNRVPYIGPISPGESKELDFHDPAHRWDDLHRRQFAQPAGVHFVGHISYVDEAGSSITRHTAFRRWYDRRSQRFRLMKDIGEEHEYAD